MADGIRPVLRSGQHRVAVLVRDGVMPMELGIVHQLFGTARSADGERLYDVVTCTPAPGEIGTDADFTVRVTAGPTVLAEADTVIVPASHAAAQTETTGWLDSGLAEALARIRPGTRIASICTGAFVLAAAGCSTAGGRPRTGCRPTCSAAGTPRWTSTPPCSTPTTAT